MKTTKKNYLWLLTLIPLALSLAACQPTQTATSTEEVEVNLETNENASTLGEEQAPIATFEPIVLEDALVTDSGLQYVELVAGDGVAPQDGDILVMEVIGTLPDGTEVVNTRASGSPAVAIFGRGQLLDGWEEGMGLMKAGGQAQMVLPPELAFGEEGYGIIPPNTQLILDVELLSVDAPPVPTEVNNDELTTTKSGLQYYDIVSGEGPEASEFSTVTTQYTIWVQDDAEYTYIVSSAYTQPISFVVGRKDVVFPGWDEGVIGMQVGTKRLLIIPAELALGEQGAGDIPPNATLVMEIELTDLYTPPQMTDIDEEDYTTTESGLKYYDLVEGDGATPEAGQTVVVHYAGWLEDGTPFDNSYDRGEPFAFELGSGLVIPGWEEGLSTMKVGGKRQLVIPADLAYGEDGAGGVIPPGATLIFEVELLEIQE